MPSMKIICQNLCKPRMQGSCPQQLHLHQTSTAMCVCTRREDNKPKVFVRTRAWLNSIQRLAQIWTGLLSLAVLIKPMRWLPGPAELHESGPLTLHAPYCRVTSFLAAPHQQ
jgi:hypothetical protein